MSQTVEFEDALEERFLHHGGGEGGFVFQQVQNIMTDVPLENIVAMLDAVNA